MTTEMTVFQNEQFGEVRAFCENDQYWFVALDISKILDYRTANDMTRTLDADEKDTRTVRTLGGDQSLVVISEAGLYSAILRSRKPEARQFKRWVTHDVLPTIRKTGGYVAHADMFIDKYLPHADEQTKVMFRVTLDTIERQNSIIEKQKPLVTFAETCIKSKDNILVRELSKIAHEQGMDIGEKKLYNKLREWGMISKHSTEPFQRYINSGYFVVEEGNVDTAYGVKLTKTTKITPRGQVYIIEKLKQAM